MDQDHEAPMGVNGDGLQHGGSIDLGAGSDGPPSILGVGPPSPLTGCYLLIIIGEPHSQDHKDIILQRLVKGFLSWDVVDCHVDLEEELHTITLQALEGEEGKHGERLIQYASENLVTEILIHPQVNTFIQCIRNLLSSFTRHRHIIHTGYTFSGNGSWILQDGTFSVVDFMEAFQEHEVQRVLRAYPDTITMDVHCAPTGQWHTIQDKSFSRLCQIRLNPVDVLDSGSEKLNSFVAYVSSMIIPTEISELLESSDVVGNIRFSHPTLYVFPGGQGDAALFGINGFNMLVDGGFSRKSCFWDFVRHLDRLDAVLMTRINNTNIKGISSVVERKSEAHVYPQIGHFFCNIPERKGLPSPDGDKDRDPLLVDLLEEGHQIVTNLKSLNLKAQNCYRESEPINLYHKVGHGTLDMYVISPSRDSREVKDFLARWTAADQRLFAKETKDGKDFAFPLQNLISICALLVWTPANPEDNITRILFPGSAPEYKILEGLEKMKNVEFMRQPVCPVKSISASLSTPVLVTKKSLKSASTDRILAEPIHASKPKDNKIIDNKMKMMQTDNKLTADAMDSSADEGKMEKQLGSKGPSAAATTVATAKVESKPKPIRRPASTAADKKIDNKKLEQQQQQQEEKKDSISDVGSDKEDQTLAKTSPAAVTAVDSEKSIDEGPTEVSEKKPDTDGVETKPEAEVKEKKKELSPPAGADTGGAVVTKSTKKPPVSRTPAARSRVDTSSKTKATTERKPVERKKQPEPNKSSPTTPKKTAPADAKLTNGSATKPEHGDEVKRTVSKVSAAKPAPLTAPKTGKSSPKATPAKSAKDENNRKVLEARQRPSAATAARREAISARKEAEKKTEAAKPQAERKPISRRPKGTAGVGGSAATLGGSPVKGKKVLKSEKDAVIRKAKLDKNGTTDSSLVSTPSADEGGVAILKRPSGTPEVMPAEGDSLEVIKQQQQQQQLAELKEEQEAVREIEAVFNRDTAAQKAQKHRELALTEEHREVQDSTTEPEEEEEYLIIEKEEQYTEDSINEPESSATKEEEIQKHQRDSQESEKRKRDSLVEEKGEEEMEKDGIAESTAQTVQIVNGTKAEAEQPQGKEGEDEEHAATEEEQEQEEVEDKDGREKLSPKHKQELEEEVQEIIASAKEIAKSKMETSMDGLKTEEMSSISPDEKMSSTKKTSDTRDENEEHELQVAGHLKEHIDPPHHESHHEERVSATVESGATTTAPTLPEDERIPLDEIKEDLVIEEKHVREITKEVEVAAAVAAVTTAAEAEAGPEKTTPAVPEASATAPLPTVYEPLERPTPAKMQFSAQQAHMRDVVKTPDEVADLPVHEEADLEEGYGEDKDKDSKEDEEKDRDTKEKPEEREPTVAGKETDGKQPEKTDDDRQVADKADESDKPCDMAKKAAEQGEQESNLPRAVEDIIEKVARDTQQEMALKTDAHQEPEEKAKLKDEVDILQDLESQIIPMEVMQEKMEKVERVHQQQLHAKDGKKTPEAEPETDDATKLPVEEELIVAQKVVPKVPLPAEADTEAAGQDDIWKTPAKAEEKLDELKHLIDDKAKSAVSELVSLKDTMVKTVVERKSEIVEKVTEELHDVDHKIKESIADAGKELEQMAAVAAVEVVKDVTEQADAVIDSLQMKAKQVDEDLKLTAGKLDEKMKSVVADVSQIASKSDETLATIATEASELEKMAMELKKDVAGQLDDTKKQLEQELTKSVEMAQEKAKGGISSFFGGITEGIKSGIEKMADKMEHKIKDKTEQVEEKLQQVTEKIDALKGEREQEVASKSAEPLEQTFDRFGPYERSFTQELRETHITTVDSPVMDGDKLSMELKSMVNIPHDIHEDKELEELEDNKNLGTFVIEDIKYSAFEDANLREIKEEEDEDRVSPPQGMVEKLGPGMVGVMPPRARTPEDVAKIVANVAEVLKSDKDLEEIIPGFDPQELERKLSQGAAREEDVSTVQRMLVTASSEDGGEETVICEDGTITFSKSATPEPVQGSGKSTPEIKVQEEDEDELAEETERQGQKKDKEADEEKKQVEAESKSSPGSSGKSSPDLKTSPTSIEEKDKHELPEKVVQVEATKVATIAASDLTSSEVRKESIADQQHPAFEHIDDQRRESAISTFSERDYTKDESSFVDERDSSRAHSISSHISDLKEDAADLKSVADFLKESEKEPDHVFGEGDSKIKDLSSPESVTSQKTISEKEPKLSNAAAEKVKVDAADTKEPTMPASKEASRPASAMSEKDSKDVATDEVKVDAAEFSRPESPASAGEASRPGSATDDHKKDDSKPIEVTRHLKESASLDLAGEQPETSAFSRPESPASTGELSPAELKDGVKEDSRPPSAASDTKAPSEKSIDAKTEQKQDSRPASAVPSEKSVDLKEQAKEESRPTSAAASEKSVELKEIQKDLSRPASAASVTEEKRPSETQVDSVKLGESEVSRPASAASEVKAPSEKSDDLKGDEKEDFRPTSAVPSEKSIDLKVEQKDESRPGSAASGAKAPSEKSVDLKGEQKDVSRPPSAVPSEKSVDLKPESKEQSRPASAASETKPSSEKSLDLKADQSRPASAASEGKAPSEKSVDLKADQMEDSRPASAIPSEKSVVDKAEEKEESRPASAAPSEKSVDLKDIQKDESRPASAASEKDGKALSEKSDDLKVERKEESRPGSAASGAQAPSEKSVDLKVDQKEDSRPASAVPSEKSVDLKSEQKEDSRPASAVPSEKSVDLKPEQKEQSRPASAASGAKTPSEKSVDLKEEEKDGSRPTSAVPSEKSVDLKEVQKEESRPASAVPSEKSVDLKEVQKEESRPASAVPSEKSVDLKEDPKEVSRPASATPSEKSGDLKPEDKGDSRPTSAAGEMKAPSETSIDMKVDPKDVSRPASAASEVKAPSEKSDDFKGDQKEDSRTASAVASEKSVDLKGEQKDVSRPPSAASEKSVDLKDEQKDASRPSSAVPSEKSADLKDDQKGDSRPPSAVPSEKSVDLKPESKEESRPASAASETKPPSEKSLDIKADQSRPASAASEGKAPSEKSVDLKADPMEDSRPALAVPSEKSLGAKAEEKEDSRPASAVPSEKSLGAKADEKEDSRPVSAAPSEKSVDLKDIQKDDSRPASAASEKDGKALSEKSDDLKVERKEESRPGSAASGAQAPSEKSVDLKVDQKEDSRPASAVPSEKSVDLKPEQKEQSRPASAASGAKTPSEKSVDLKEEEKDGSRPTSAVPSEKSVDLKEAQKEESRPASAVPSEKSVNLKEGQKEESRPASAVPSEKSVDLKEGQKDESRPASAVPSEKSIDAKEDQKDESRSPSATPSEKTGEIKAEPKEESRPASAVPSEKSVDLNIEKKEEESRPASAVPSEKSATSEQKDVYRPVSAVPSEKSVDIPTDHKETSRPASAASEKEGIASSVKDDANEFSRPESPASAGEASRPGSAMEDQKKGEEEKIVEVTRHRKESASLDLAEELAETTAFSRPESPASTGELSRPASAQPEDKSDKPVEPTSEVKDSRSPSVASVTVDLKAESKDSRPPSAVPSEKSLDLKPEPKDDSRPGSAASDAKPPSEKSGDLKTRHHEDSRPTSAVPSEKSVDLKADDKEVSRPASATSEAKAPSEKSDDLKDQKEGSRPASTVPSEKSIDLKIDQKEESRPGSAVSGTNVPTETSELKTEQKEESRPASAVPSEKSIDLKSEQKQDTRPGSAASDAKAPSDRASPSHMQTESKDQSRPASSASDAPTQSPADKADHLQAASREHSRPASAASDRSEKNQSELSRPASTLSGKAEKSPDASKEPSRPESAASEKAGGASASKEPSRPASAASVKSTTSETKKETHEVSTVSSFAKFEESLSRRESSSTTATKEERPTSALSGGEEDEQDNNEKVCLKETRSKSMSAVMSSNVQRSGFEGSTLGVLEESMITSRDDLDMLRSPRDSVTKIDASLTQKLAETTSTSSLATKSFKPLFDDTPQFPAAKVEEGPNDREKESTGVFPKCGLDSTESPEHGPTIAQGMDQLLKDTVSTMKEIEKMTSSVITSTVQAKKEGSAFEQVSKSDTSTGLGTFPVSDSGKSSPYLGDKSHESSAKSVSPLPDKDSLEESSTSLNTFIEKDSLSEGITKQQKDPKELVSIRMSPVGESIAERESVPAAQSHKASEELLFAGSKTPPTAPISPNVAVKEEVSHGAALIMQSQPIDSSILPGSTSSATTLTSSTTATTGAAAAPKDDASGISTPKESVPSGKSSPGLMSVHTQGSTDSASKSINLGHSSSGVETSDSSPKPTSPFPKVVVVDTLKLADETKTTSGMSTPDMTRSSTPDMVDSQIERIAPAATGGEKSDSQQTFTTTTTTTKTTTYIIKDGQKIEVDSNVHSDTVSEPTKEVPAAASTGSVPAGSSTTTTTTTTSYILKDGQKVEESSSVSSTKPSVPAQLTLAATEQHTLAEDYDEKEILSPRSDISSGQASRIVAAWHDEDVPGSPMSVTSQAPLSPSTKYTYDYDLQHSSSGVSKKSDIEIDQDSQDDLVPPQYGSDEAKAALPLVSSFKPDPMSTSFYGQLPEVTPITSATLASSTARSVPIPIAGSGKGFSKPYVEYASSGDSSVDSSHKPSMATDGDRKYLDDADLDFEKTFSRGKMMDDLMTTSMHFSSEKEFMAATTTAAAKEQAQKMEMDFTSTGLPSSATTTTTVVASAQPTVTTTLPQSTPQSQAQSQSAAATTMLPQSTTPQPTAPPTASAPSSSEVKSVLDSWGKPLSLPSPAPMTTEDNKTTPKKERRLLMSKTKLNNEKNLRKRAESPSKAAAKKPASPVYVDLSYVPHHGNSYYANVEFFKRVRARYYVFSGTEPSREVYNALLEAKQTWEDKELEVTIIPTYDTDVLGYWVSENEELLAKYHIDLSPSAARCTINLQDHETSCSAYRLEF
ncbi:microtubule-associated protein futsch [Anopheles ziemanni]|uniref:microtubule-associated protein futsch n=1 Tax=Anopheles coustani TaxID=139045 RepID=UPI0026593844|nr:microtubule-associated protein futsch [Anopheles coustani]XP_058174201.1 microtubule-associated protein futsch [Anopheles ziemanni]